MKSKLLTLLFLFFCLLGRTQMSNKDSQEWKKAKRIAKENRLKCRVVFCGPVIDYTIKELIEDELSWLTYAGIETRCTTTGKDCDYCEDLIRTVQNYEDPKIYSFNTRDRQFNCNSLDCPYFESTANLQEDIIHDVINSKHERISDIVIVIPAKSEGELVQLLIEGWSVNKPIDEKRFEKRVSVNCAGQELVLYKEKACEDISSIELEWPEIDEYSPENGYKYIFAHKGRSNYFFFYTQRICANKLKLRFYQGDKVIDTFDVKMYPMESGELMYFEIMITRDNYDAHCFSDKCDDMELYVLKICDDDTNECKDLGSYKFIHCSK